MRWGGEGDLPSKEVSPVVQELCSGRGPGACSQNGCDRPRGGGGGVCCCVGGDAAVTMELERWEAGGGQGAGAMLGTCIFILRAV